MCLLSTLVFGQTVQFSSESASELVDHFKSTTDFWKQFKVAKKIVALRDKSVLQDLEPWLSHDDRHLGGNAAFIFAGLGDDHGFEVIKQILSDRSARPPGQGQGFFEGSLTASAQTVNSESAPSSGG
jgi:hypothetical protein